MKSLTLTMVVVCSQMLSTCWSVPRTEHVWRGEDGLMLRLTGGDTVDEGLVEVHVNGSWGSLCDDLVGKQTADIICRMLEYPRAKAGYCCGRLGRLDADAPIWLDQLDCQGSENSIFSCSHASFGDHDCKHYEDVGVVCQRPKPRIQDLKIRLYCPDGVSGSCNTCPVQAAPRPAAPSAGNGTEDCEDVVAVRGLLQAYHPEERRWVFLSGEGWDEPDVRVACGQLGYPDDFGYPSVADLLGCDPSEDSTCGGEEFRANFSSVSLRNMDCTGLEHDLGHCLHFGYAVTGNAILDAATVSCGYRQRHSGCPDETQSRVRLRGGPLPSEGRVEVFRDGKWGSVEDHTFYFPEATVICRSLGYGTARRYEHNSQFGFGIGPVAFRRVKCIGNESSIEQCTRSDLARERDHKDDVGVVCNRPMERCGVVARYHMERKYSARQSYLEVQVGGVWGLVCRDMLDRTDQTVVCRDLEENFAERIRQGAATYNGTRFVGRFGCQGDEVFLEDCPMTFVSVEACPGGEAIIDCARALPDLVPNLEWTERSFRETPFLKIQSLGDLRCEVEEGCLGSDALLLFNQSQLSSRRKLLTFHVLSDNRGMYDFRPFVSPDEWEFHECHNHYHAFEEFALYDLRWPNGTLAAEGLKASYCLADTFCFGYRSRSYQCRGQEDQGITVGCGDLYSSRTPCQWIDVTHVAHGNYLLEVLVNPQGLVPELDLVNNMISCNITLAQNNRINSHGCAIRGY